jgi:dipeptidyl-peptidase 4
VRCENAAASRVIALCLLGISLGLHATAAEQNRSGATAPEIFPLAAKVLNLDAAFKWIAGSDRFWFKRQTGTGEEFITADAASGRQSPAFDMASLRAALSVARPGIVGASELSITDLVFEPNGSGIVLKTPAGSFACDAPVVTRCVEHAAALGADFIASPDGSTAVHRRGDDLWLRDLASGTEKRLTDDGEPNFGYGDTDNWRDLREVARRRIGIPSPLVGVRWSPDGRYVLALRQDLRPYPERLLVTEYVPPDGGFSRTYSQRIGTPGDAKRPDSRLVVIDTKTSTVHAVSLDPQALNDYALEYLITGVVWWSANGDELFLLTANRGGTRYGLSSIDLSSGRAREILEESSRFNVRLNPSDYARPNVYVSASGQEFLWYSERSGYGHLYLYDAATGRLKRELTAGSLVVFDLLRVDETKRFAYFTAGPRRAGDNPYYSYLYRVSLDGGEPQLLTPEIADHEFPNSFGAFGPDFSGVSDSRISPSGRYFIDSYSSTEQPPKVVIRKSSGELVAKLFTSDASALNATGWAPPEPVVAKASDGTTDLYGVIFRPRDFDPSRNYPIIDFMYPGPQGHWAPISFKDNILGHFGNSQAFADAGFIVVCIDARGTGARSRAFRDAFLGSEDVLGAADHVAAIRNLAASRPYMNVEKVGVMGHSFGGYGSLRAMLLYPDFFRVGVSGVGPGDWFHLTSEVSVERFFGVPTASAKARAFYDIASNTRLTSRLQGRVLLIYGGIDENVPLINAFIVLDAFIKANKDVDTLILPNAPHSGVTDPYAVRRSVQYFTEHLGEGAGK